MICINCRTFAALFIISMAVSGLQAVEIGDTTSRVLDDVVVTGARYQTDIRHLPMTVSIVDRSQLTATQRLNVLPTLAEEVPGLFVTQRGMLGFGVSDGAAGGISLRGLGSGSGRIMVLIDGHPQYQGIFGHSISDSYQTMMAEQVEVLRGPASALYGSNAMGGVVNIVTRKMRDEGVKTDIRLGVGSYGTFQSELTNRLRTGKFYSIASAQYSRSDNHRPRMGFEQYGGYVKLGYYFSPNWTAYADIDLTHFNASYPGSTQTPIYDARQWITRGVTTAVVENRYRNTSGAVSVYHNFGRHKINDGYEDGKDPATAYFLSNDALTGISLYQSFNFFSGNHITLVLDYQHIYGKAWNRVMSTGEYLEPMGDERENDIAGYVSLRQDILSWLTADVGMRIDHHSQSGTEWIPQGGLVFRIINSGELKAIVGKGFRNPTIKEMYLWRPANSSLAPERMISYELSWRQRLADGVVSYGANLFYINADNLIQTQMVDGRPLNVNTGAIENTGVELDFSWRISRHWELNGNYSYLHQHNPTIDTPTHKAWLGTHYTGKRWRLNGGLQYINGLYTAVGTDESKENFLLLNASASYDALKCLTLWVKGENLLAQKYELRLGYPMPRATFMVGVNLRLFSSL